LFTSRPNTRKIGISFLHEIELYCSEHKLTGQSCDGASIVRGVGNDVQTKIKEIFTLSHLNQCYTHHQGYDGQDITVMMKGTDMVPEALVILTN
jgi:hypothetical protein